MSVSYIHNLSTAWCQLVRNILGGGMEVTPRGMKTKELRHHTVQVDMRRPVLTVPGRKLGYKFMAAEAYWILTGDDRVSTIAPYAKNIAKFSDDGETFFGAYGPKVVTQMPYVIDTLIQDPNSRQAGLTVWRESPEPSKDIPCTIAIWFTIRNRYLHCHVFMRSSDAWLGLPYDVFNFSMISHALMAGLLRESEYMKGVEPGVLYLTAASSHLYEPQWESAKACAEEHPVPPCKLTPSALFEDDNYLLDVLGQLRSTGPGHPLRWWEGK